MTVFLVSIMTSKEDHKLYEKILDTFLVLRDVSDRFKTYSARDINALIASKMRMKTDREQIHLHQLYRLEAMIKDVRESMAAAKAKADE